jgi:hypothetical protein
VFLCVYLLFMAMVSLICWLVLLFL